MKFDAALGTRRAVQQLQAIVAQFEVGGIVAGLPITMIGGVEDHQCHKWVLNIPAISRNGLCCNVAADCFAIFICAVSRVRNMVDAVCGPLSNMPVTFWDERESTVHAKQHMFSEEGIPRELRKQRVYLSTRNSDVIQLHCCSNIDIYSYHCL